MKQTAFKFCADWVKFGDAIKDARERINYYTAISRYGVYGTPPANLSGETLSYFNERVRPIIDKQRKSNHNEGNAKF